MLLNLKHANLDTAGKVALLDALTEAAQRAKGTVLLRHVRAHAGVKGNEKADKPADWKRHNDPNPRAPRPDDQPLNKRAALGVVKAQLAKTTTVRQAKLDSHSGRRRALHKHGATLTGDRRQTSDSSPWPLYASRGIGSGQAKD